MHIILNQPQTLSSIKVISSNVNLVEWTIQTIQLLLIRSEKENRNCFLKPKNSDIKFVGMQKQIILVIITDCKQQISLSKI